jgi:hypothetical protein
MKSIARNNMKKIILILLTLSSLNVYSQSHLKIFVIPKLELVENFISKMKFENQRNPIDIVNAKHKGAENISYAIKAS